MEISPVRWLINVQPDEVLTNYTKPHNGSKVGAFAAGGAIDPRCDWPCTAAMHSDSSRRHFLQTSLAAGTALAFPAIVKGASETPKIEVDDLRVISHQPEYYHGWPTVVRRADGELILTWSGRREAHICPFGTVEMMRSRDSGTTWTFPRTLIDGPIDDRDSGVLETAKGSLIVTTFTSLAYQTHVMDKGKKLDDANWLAAHNRLPSDEARQNELGEWAIRSTDGGVTWSERIDTIVNSPHGPIQLTDGRLLYAGKKLWSDPRTVGVAESKDDGLTWQWLADIPTREGDDAFGSYHELHAVECADGKIIAQIRNHNKVDAGKTLQTASTDGGKTWSVPKSTGVYGLPSHLLRLKDDRIVMSYGHRRKPFGNQARISSDNGTTWSDALIISGDGPGGDLGYPSTVELDDGRLLSVWYEKLADSSRAVLRQAIWRLS